MENAVTDTENLRVALNHLFRLDEQGIKLETQFILMQALIRLSKAAQGEFRYPVPTGSPPISDAAPIPASGPAVAVDLGATP